MVNSTEGSYLEWQGLTTCLLCVRVCVCVCVCVCMCECLFECARVRNRAQKYTRARERQIQREREIQRQREREKERGAGDLTNFLTVEIIRVSHVTHVNEWFYTCD